MDLRLTEAQSRLQKEIRAFLKSIKEKGEYPFTNDSLQLVFSPEFSQKLAEKGWIGIAWPKEFGGQGAGYLERCIILEELLKSGAPVGYHYLADRQVGPGIIHFGSDFLKNEFLQKMLNAQVSFCLLFSEPNAGSDLAACETSAVEEGDYFILNGQKTWTSHGHSADYGWGLMRTSFDSETPRHNAFSEILINMKTPGITIRPVINMVGLHSFNEVFFDNVKIHKKYLIGKKGNGFRQIMTNLVYERATIDRLIQNYSAKEALFEYVKNTEKDGVPLSKDPIIRDSLAKLEVEFQVGRKYIYYVTTLLDDGKIPDYEAAIGKNLCTLFEAKLSDMATNIMGLHGLIMPDSPEALFKGIVAESYLMSPSYTLQGGSVEILKNIIAKRGLKLSLK